MMRGGGRMGRSWKVMISWYLWNFHTWLEMDLTSKNVLLWENKPRLISKHCKRRRKATERFAAYAYLNTAISKLTRRMFATRR